MNHLRHEYRFSDQTLVDCSSYCREVDIHSMFNNCEKIGGKDVIIEIDESKFEKVKY